MQKILQLPVYIFSSPFPSRRCFWTKAFLGMFYHLLLKKRENKIGFASLDTLNKICIKMSLRILFAKRVTHDMLCTLENIITACVNGHTLSRISRICGNITVFQEMFTSPL